MEVDPVPEGGSTVPEELAETAAARSNVYGFLAAVFRAEPTAALVRELKSPAFSEILAGLGCALGEECREASLGDFVENLALEYTRLFIGPGPRISPHESLHVDIGAPSENTLWGPQTAQVKRFIEATGLEYDDRFTGLPDHISAEFELMQRLAEREAQAWGENDEEDACWCQEVQTQFFNDHLNKWIPNFCDKVTDMAEMDFYRGIAALTKDFLEFEQEHPTGRSDDE